MSKVIDIRKNREAEASAAFSEYVQSIAFNLTLSKAMIGALQLVRDDARIPLPSIGRPKDTASAVSLLGRCVPLMRALSRRGLVWHDYIPPMEAPEHHQYHKLTRAGELVCDLLVEAGLMAAVPKQGRKRA